MAQKKKPQYATMDGCPIRGCTDPLIVTVGDKPTVPGVKRHVRHWHPDKFDSVRWPDARRVSSGKKVAAAIRGTKPKARLADQKVTDLRKAARRKGIDPQGMRKSELVKALS